MTIKEQLHHSDTHQKGKDLSCPVCNPAGFPSRTKKVAAINRAGVVIDITRFVGGWMTKEEAVKILKAVQADNPGSTFHNFPHSKPVRMYYTEEQREKAGQHAALEFDLVVMTKAYAAQPEHKGQYNVYLGHTFRSCNGGRVVEE